MVRVITSFFFHRIVDSLVIDDTTSDEHLAPSNPTIYYDTEPCPNPSVAAATELIPTCSSLEALPRADETVIPLCNHQQYRITSQPMAFAQTQQLSPTPPQSETVTSHELTLDYSRKLLAIVKEAIRCSTCSKIFNRAVICHDYLIQLNRPIQCACGCVICTLCYQHQRGCSQHNVSSSRGPVNAIANNLTSCPDLKNLGDWDLERNADDHFKMEANTHVQQMIKEVPRPGFRELQNGRYLPNQSLIVVL